MTAKDAVVTMRPAEDRSLRKAGGLLLRMRSVIIVSMLS